MVKADARMLDSAIRAVLEASILPATIVVYANDGHTAGLAKRLERRQRLLSRAYPSDVTFEIRQRPRSFFEGAGLSAFYGQVYKRAGVKSGPRIVPIYVSDSPRLPSLSNARAQARLRFFDARGVINDRHH